MESLSEISDEQLQEILEDKEALQTCRDIMDSSLFLRQKSRIELPNVDMELERFKNANILYECIPTSGKRELE